MSSSPLPETSSGQTFEQAAEHRMKGLWSALHGGSCPKEVRTLLSTMFRDWGSQTIPSAPEWFSDIGNDHSPFEFSVAWTSSAAPELRVVVEAQGADGSFSSTRSASLRLHETLVREGADVGRFEQIRDLFLPVDVRKARFAMWHSVTLGAGPLRAKVYLNPQVRGPSAAPSLIESALQRLHLDGAWPIITSSFPGLRGEDIRYFALDLDPSADARVKIYVYRANATIEEFERVASLLPEYKQGEVTDFCRAMTGSTGPYLWRPPCVYLAFTRNQTVPSDITIQVPIAYHTLDDAAARDLVLQYLRLHGLDSEGYARALHAAATRPLEAGRGLHTYVSLRTARAPTRVTTYFAAELYGARAPSSTSSHVRVKSAAAAHDSTAPERRRSLR